MSGVVNAVLKQGTENFAGRAPRSTSAASSSRAARTRAAPTTRSTRPASRATSSTLSGPLPLAEDDLPAQRPALPLRRLRLRRAALRSPPTVADFADQRLRSPPATARRCRWATPRSGPGVVKITNTLAARTPSSTTRPSSTRREGRAHELRLPLQSRRAVRPSAPFSISHGLDWTQTLGATTFLDLSLRQNYFDYEDFVYEDVYDPRYDEAGPPDGDAELRDGAIVQGVQLHPLRAEDQHLRVQGLGRQPGRRRAPGEDRASSSACPRSSSARRATWPSPRSAACRRSCATSTSRPTSRRVQTYYPVIGAAFVQDQMEWHDLTVRAGLRLDYFDARSTVPSDLANPANAIAGRARVASPGRPRSRPSLSPRLGVAYPIEDKAAIHFAYGHFHQFPADRRRSSRNADYDVLTQPAGGRRQTTACWAIRTSSPRRPSSTRSATSRRSPPDLGLRPHRLLQGHPRPARRRVHRDLQRRRVRAADQRRLRQRPRHHPGPRPPPARAR